MTILGENRREAISAVQEKLGPLTSRPIAEDTFWELAKQKKITLSEAGQYLMEDDVTDEKLRNTAKHTMKTRMSNGRRRVGYTFKNKSQLKTRVMSSLKSALSPDLPADLGEDADDQ